MLYCLQFNALKGRYNTCCPGNKLILHQESTQSSLVKSFGSFCASVFISDVFMNRFVFTPLFFFDLIPIIPLDQINM